VIDHRKPKVDPRFALAQSGDATGSDTCETAVLEGTVSLTRQFGKEITEAALVADQHDLVAERQLE
jgi:hypothetical protein